MKKNPQLPLHIIRKGKWYFNTKTGQYIHPDQIAKFLPDPKPYSRNIDPNTIARSRWMDTDKD